MLFKLSVEGKYSAAFSDKTFKNLYKDFELKKIDYWIAKAKQKLRHCVIIIMIILSFNVILRTSTVVPIFTGKETEIEKG